MLPKGFRNRMFEHMSNKTMRSFFSAVRKRDARGLVAAVLEQSEEDFFINGTITCHSVCPELMAGMWLGGRESTLVSDQLPAWLKKAMGAALSRENQCPYCEDMLVSLTYGARENNLAAVIRKGAIDEVENDSNRAVMQWVRASTCADSTELHSAPFTAPQLPEAIGTILTFSYTNKVTDFTMSGSPVGERMKGLMLRVMGSELAESAAMELEPGRSLALLPEAPLPADLEWARSNARIADALSRWAQAVDQAVDRELPSDLRHWLEARIAEWRGGPVPLSRQWVDDEVADLTAPLRDKAKLVLLIAKASYQIDDGVIEAVRNQRTDDAGLIRIGAWAALTAARRTASWCAEATEA